MQRKLFFMINRHLRNSTHRRMWARVVQFMACIVVFCTTYALILPAITIEKQCQLEEHSHTTACYAQLTSVQAQSLICDTAPHCHGENCYAEEELICGQADFLIHSHNEFCYDGENLICPLSEISLHSHSSQCYEEGSDQSVCGQEEVVLHRHWEDCYAVIDGVMTLVCAQPEVLEHVHTEDCVVIETIQLDVTELTCTLSEESHTHGEQCYGQWELTCELEEHDHSVDCTPLLGLSEEDRAEVEAVIAMIDALPTYDEFEATLLAFEEAEDNAGFEAYYIEIGIQGRTAYDAYAALTAEQQACVTNMDRLMELSSVWSTATLEYNDQGGFTIYARNAINSVNTNGEERPILVYGNYTWAQYGISSDKITNKNTLWRVIEVHENRVNGRLYVHYISGDAVLSHFVDNWGLPQYIDYDGDGINEGFNVLIPTAYFNKKCPNLKVGDAVSVTVNADNEGNSSNLTEYYHRSSDKNNNQGLYDLFFGTDPKEPRDNSNQLTVVQGANTLDLIEVNLFDYNNNINSKYFSDANGGYNFLGFQQDYGTKSIGTKLEQYSFNFGNNITTDLDAGDTDITNRGGNINGIAYSANRPISGVIRNTLHGRYPITNAGYSFDFYFNQSGAAHGVTKLNDKNIDGLFLYNEETGAYTFDSRENHAQFDAATDKFILYKQRFSPNFIMYPFGNFMPLNDINTQCVQASKADRSYLLEMARSAKYKRQNGAREEYGTLSNVLYKFVDEMDELYGMRDWTSGNIVQQYFDRSPYKDDLAEDPGRILNDLLPWIYTLDYDEPSNFYFGMSMRMNLMMPKDGMTGKNNAHPMVFEFAGDDDVWVYIDGVLFLDLSGIHRHVGGEIDFKNGVVRYYAFDSYIDGRIQTEPYDTKTFAQILTAAGKSTDVLNEKGTFKDYSTHAFDFFYTERGSGSSVCRMNFNFPLLKQNAISVVKELTSTTNVELLGNPDFEFQILKEDTTEPFIGEGVRYTIYDSTTNAPIGTGTTTAHGFFTLKAGQRAEFTGINENSGKYYVRERLDKDLVDQYDKFYVDGTAVTKSGLTVTGGDEFRGVVSPVKDISDGTTVFTFNNHVDAAKLGYLTITKWVHGTPTGYDKYYNMKVLLDGKPIPAGTTYDVYDTVEYQQGNLKKFGTYTVQDEGIIPLPHGCTAWIPNIMAGTTFHVSEDSGSAEGYVVSYSPYFGESTPSEDGISGVIPLAADPKDSHVCVIVNNTEIGPKDTTISIPGSKSLINGAYDPNTTHTYSFSISCYAATDKNGRDLKAQFSGHNTSATVAVKGTTPAPFQFDLHYTESMFPSETTFPVTVIYTITENKPELLESTHDGTIYVATVTIAKDNLGGLTATLAPLTKYGQSGTYEQAGFHNALLGYLTLNKQVVGGTLSQQNGSFDFTVQISKSDTEALVGQTIYVTVNGEYRGNLTTNEQGCITVPGVKHGATVGLYNIPLGCVWRITETNADGYLVTWTTNGAPGSSNVATGNIPAGGMAVVFTNTSTYALPETGGAGTTSYTMAGLVLILFSMAFLLYKSIPRRREAFQSP